MRISRFVPCLNLIADVFRTEISHILIVTTPINIILIGLEFDPHTHDSVNLSNYRGRNLNFDADSIRIIPTDNVVMNAIVSTDNGRIFLGAQDGCIYEVIYEACDPDGILDNSIVEAVTANEYFAVIFA